MAEAVRDFSTSPGATLRKPTRDGLRGKGSFLVEGNEEARGDRILLHALWRRGTTGLHHPSTSCKMRTSRPGSSQSPGQQQEKMLCSDWPEGGCALIGQEIISD